MNAEIGLIFARALRAVLRQGPVTIMVGEIRDPETAEIACRAALVGRLVLATLHTSWATAAFRLRDLGVEQPLIDDVLLGVLGQRLELQPCAECGGEGCAACGGAGVAARRLFGEFV